MINKSKIALIAAIVAMAASPALAQSFSPGYGTGNISPYAAGSAPAQNGGSVVRHTGRGRVAVRQNGLEAYAMVPAAPSASAEDTPARAGGGSLGYNQTLETY